MLRYAKKTNEKKSAKVYGRSLPISAKDSAAICRAITGRNLEKAKSFLLDMLAGNGPLDGKLHTKAALEIAGLLNSAGSNAEFKGLDAGRLIVHASAHEGYTFYRPRRFKMHGRKKKVTNVQVVLEER